MKTLLALIILSAFSFGQTAAREADVFKARYRACEKHHVSADKCTPEIYRQLSKKQDGTGEAKDKQNLLNGNIESELELLYACDGLEESDGAMPGYLKDNSPAAESFKTPAGRERCSQALEWLKGNGLGASVRRERELLKRRSCEKDGGVWLAPSSDCGEACRTEQHCEMYVHK